MVVNINIEAQQNTAGFIYFGKQGAFLYIGLSSHAHAAKDSDQNCLTSPMLLVKRCKQWPAAYTWLTV